MIVGTISRADGEADGEKEEDTTTPESNMSTDPPTAPDGLREGAAGQSQVPEAGPVLIVGCQRSGTTLVRRMCDRHPRLDVMPETHLLPLLWGEARPIRRLGRGGMATWIRRTLPRVNPAWSQPDAADRLDTMCDRFCRDASHMGDAALAHAASIFAEWLEHWRVVSGAPRPGEKTPSHIYYLPALLRALPNAQAVVMHRDPRAAGCSEWIKHRSIDTPGRRFTWLRFAVRWVSSVEVAAQCAEDFGRDRVLQLRYEDLVKAPEDTARRLCEFLREPFYPGMIEVENPNTSFARLSADRSDGRGIDTESLDRWRRTLDPSSVSSLEALTAQGMKALGYEREARGSVPAMSWTGWGVRAIATLARYHPTSFNQMASRKRYAGLLPDDLGRPSA